MSEHTRSVTLEWTGDLRFSGGPPDGPATVVDGDLGTGPAPMHQLLVALAGCMGADIVSILPKMQVALATCSITATGERRAEPPQRYVSLHLDVRLAGEGLDLGKARRAIDLSLEKYCSVRHSLDPAIPVTYDLELP